MRSVSYAPEAWRYLNGIFCVYKPSELFTVHVRNTLKFNLCRDLNEMEKRPPRDRVELKGSVISGQPFSVELVPNYADHELVSGPRYQVQDIRMVSVSHLGKYTSGVLPIAINDGCGPSRNFVMANFLRRYKVKGKFGLATDTSMADGKVKERSTYYHIRQAALDRVLASIQSYHQAMSYKYSGVDMQSQEAYELASKGMVRPCGKTDPMLYGVKCSEFNLPEFTLDIQCINETEEFLTDLIHNVGIHLKSTAVCTHLQRTQFGHFTLDHALLRKHWTLEHILNNITLCKRILGEESIVPNSAHFETIKASKIKQAILNMQEEARQDKL